MRADDHASGNAADSCDHGSVGGNAGSSDDDECVDAGAMTDDDSDDCGHLTVADKAEVLAAEGETIVIGVVEAFGGGAAIAVTPSEDAQVLAASASKPMLARVSASALAFTGDHIMLMVVAALLALAAGAVMIRTTRRTRVEA